MKCPRCKNPMIEGISGDLVCQYCIWKGDEGPGALLRKIIKEEREKPNESI